MTVIAANRKCMAADHFVSGGGVPYFTVKIFRHGDHIMGAAGISAATTKWFEWMRRDCPPVEEIDLAGDGDNTFVGLVLNEDGLFMYNALCEPDHLMSEFYAIGSGSRYAMAMLADGKSPARAVQRACEYDDGCRLYVPPGAKEGQPTVLHCRPKTSKTRLKHQKITPEAEPATTETPSGNEAPE
jgi:hypothetical protein